MKKIALLASLFALVFVLESCGNGKKSEKDGFNLFTVAQDKQLGAQTAAHIDSNTREYPLLDSVKYKDAYAYLYKMRDAILNSGKVKHRDDFVWRLRIIQNDSTLNAFCTPGGYIYVYTGLMKFLDAEDQLAGVMGHEIAHADSRHSTEQMTKMYGVTILSQIATGGRQNLAQVVSAIIGLKFSRKHETEADTKSVEYLCPTNYNANGGGKFFEKIQALGGARQPEFLSTHPAPANRIENFNNQAITMGCTGKNDFKAEHARVIATLTK